MSTSKACIRHRKLGREGALEPGLDGREELVELVLVLEAREGGEHREGHDMV